MSSKALRSQVLEMARNAEKLIELHDFIEQNTTDPALRQNAQRQRVIAGKDRKLILALVYSAVYQSKTMSDDKIKAMATADPNTDERPGWSWLRGRYGPDPRKDTDLMNRVKSVADAKEESERVHG